MAEKAKPPRTRRKATGSEVLSLLGLARRSGGVALGVRASREALRSGAARLVLTADDASPVQLEKILGMVGRRDVPHRILTDRSELGAALGSRSVSAVAVTNPSLAEQILERLPS